MFTKTIDDIRKLDPCYDPGVYLPEDWTGTALDIMRVEECPFEDRWYVVFREDWIGIRAMRLYIIECAQYLLDRMPKPNSRLAHCLDVSRQYTNGKCHITEHMMAREFVENERFKDDNVADAIFHTFTSIPTLRTYADFVSSYVNDPEVCSTILTYILDAERLVIDDDTGYVVTSGENYRVLAHHYNPFSGVVLSKKALSAIALEAKDE